MHALEIERPDRQVCRVVVRRHGSAAWKPLEANVTATEFALLGALHRGGLAVPEPRLLDESGNVLPTPYLVMEFVTGKMDVDPAALPGALERMAGYLARLHALDVGAARLPPLPEREDPREGVWEFLPANAFAEELRVALARSDPRPASSPALVHGDFWPGNILWRDDEIAAVIDWEDAALGDPLSDLACARVELLCHYDRAAMDAFTEHYVGLARVDLAELPVWELYVSAAALATMANWGLEPEVEARRRARTSEFMERAGRALLSRAG